MAETPKMSAASNAAALAGIAENVNIPTHQRLMAARQSLDYFVDQQQEALRELLSAWRIRAESDNPSEYLDGE